ncbi:histidine phosphatase family protein [Pontiellaceae bacterium B12219]|nr:histidine phosphatase family protein [Pontiellaceae bacterium B12219]
MEVLKNTYYAFRHGQSRANVEGIIISDPAIGTVEYGLTDEGREQVRTRLAAISAFDADTMLVSSDFRRARETAEIIRAYLGAAPIVFDIRLRERFFGDWEGKAHGHYSKAWKKDLFDPNREFNGAESSNSVRSRMWAVVQSLEEKQAGRTIVLVSHGDPLMLLQTAFNDLGPEHHRSLPYIETAGCRKLNG